MGLKSVSMGLHFAFLCQNCSKVVSRWPFQNMLQNYSTIASLPSMQKPLKTTKKSSAPCSDYGVFFCFEGSCVTYVLQLDCRSARRTRKINLLVNQKGYDNSETTDEKLSARRIQIFPVPSSVIIF